MVPEFMDKTSVERMHNLLSAMHLAATAGIICEIQLIRYI